MPSYYITIPESDIEAEVSAPSTRQAQTTYPDYLTRNDIIPWRGRNKVRDFLIVDRIEPGSMPVDINLDYKLERNVGESKGPAEEPISAVQMEALEPAPIRTPSQMNPPVTPIREQPYTAPRHRSKTPDQRTGPLTGKAPKIMRISREKLGRGLI